MKPLKATHLVKEYWPRFKRRSILFMIIGQIIVLGSLTAILYVFGVFETHFAPALILLGAATLLNALVAAATYKYVARPAKYLIDALVHVAGEPSATTPPNPNDAQFEKNGFNSVLQTVYQLSANTELAAVGEGTTTPATGSSLQSALDQSLCGFVVMDQNRTITYASKATPIKVDTEGVQSLDLLFNDADTLNSWWDECEASAVHAEKTWPRIPNKLPNEERRRFFDVIASYNKGATSEMVITLIDRTHLYQVGEEELDFIAFAAHELRGPITVIRGYIDVLSDELDTTLQADQKELFRRLDVSASRLAGYINNILNTSRFDRRHLKMHLAETSVADVYATIQDDMALRASSQGRALSVSIPDGLPTIAADTASLGEVFSNLIDNAIKYSNEGGAITFSAASKGDTVEVSVQDYGIGMPSSVVSNLFQKFYRSHRSRETVAGTGIGLYISKAIVESHGGNISVRSEDGHGSTFTISLPTYKTVADKLQAGDNGNETLIQQNGSWIKNHNMYRG